MNRKAQQKVSDDDLAMHLTPEPGVEDGEEDRVEPTLDLDEVELVEEEVSPEDDVQEASILDADPLGMNDVHHEDNLDLAATATVPTTVDPEPDFDVPNYIYQDRMVPRIAIDVFCLAPDCGGTLQRVASDRRLSRAHMTVHMGGVVTAVEHYAGAPTPNLIIVELSGARDNILSELEQLAQVCDEGTKVVVIGQVNDIQLYRELMRQGVSEYLVVPLNVAGVIETISGLYADPTSAPIGRSVVFAGVKGGAGSSTLAHNVAWCISERMSHDVTLIDFDLPFGTTGLDFNQDPNQGIADALTDPDRLDDQLLDRLLVKCSDHLSLFTAPGTLDREFSFETNAFDTILDTVRATVPCMVVDLPHIWDSWTRHILLTADEIVLTATPDLASLRNAKNMIEILNAARENDAPPRLVLNQVGVQKRPEIPAKDFAEAVGVEVDLVLPFDAGLFGTAANNGQMVGELKPDCKTTAGFVNLAEKVANREEVKAKKSGMKKFLDSVLGK